MLLQCYIDPATGSKFFSKPEVYRYLESMQINGGSSQQREEGSSKHSSNKVCFTMFQHLAMFGLLEQILKDLKEHVEIYKAIAGYHLVSIFPSVHLCPT